MLPKKYRLKNQQDFEKIYKNGKKYRAGCFILIALSRPKSDSNKNIRFGFVASKKVGKAVQRNQAKRKLRAVVAEEIEILIQTSDCVFIAFSNLPDTEYTVLKEEIQNAFKALDLYK